MEDFFEHIWELLKSHGVVPSEREMARSEWNKYNLDQKRSIYRTIRDKIRAGKFVNYHPHLAIRENAPKQPRIISISAEQYYAMYHTQANKDGWVRTFLPDQHKTIYVKTT
jgi:hypothetical protein